jgi:hypothetical protein
MRAYLQERDAKLRADRRLREAQEFVSLEHHENVALWRNLKAADVARKNAAATCIASLYRGFLGRLDAEAKLRERNAARGIQRRWRGVLGKRRAQMRRWELQGVAPSPHALSIITRRSRVACRVKEWREMYDPDTRSFWYLHESEMISSWEPPDCFKSLLTCVWDPWPHPYLSPLDKPCRQSFPSRKSYISHRLTAHRWQCRACESMETSLTFPVCSICGNHLDGAGQDVIAALQQRMPAALREMELQEAYRKKAQLQARRSAPTEHSRNSEPGKPQEGGVGPDAGLEIIRRGSPAVSIGLHLACTLKAAGAPKSPAGSSGTPAPSRSPSRFLRICREFLDGKCTTSTCPLAHPGIRDSARVKDGLVEVCPRALAAALGVQGEGGCPMGKRCSQYHPYVRPSTAAILQRLQKSSGSSVADTSKRRCPSGLTLEVDPPSGLPLPQQVGPAEQAAASWSWAVLTWPDDSVFLGQFDTRSGRRQGLGLFRAPDGREYVGQFAHGVRSGIGILTFPDGESYEGEFREGAMQGLGRLIFANGDEFAGEIARGEPNGIGTFRRSNGDAFTGHVVAGKAEGVGVLSLASGEIYRGYFSDDVRCGRGFCSWPGGLINYAGGWEGGRPEGYGIMSTASGERYTGYWRRGLRHGQGRYVFSNGDMYHGEFKHGKAAGEGTYRSASGDCYTGQWHDDLKNGEGRHVWAKGGSYTGTWRHGKAQGKGLLQLANGECYQGSFDCNFRHGRGCYRWQNGNVYTGDFVKNEMQGEGVMQYALGGHRFSGSWFAGKKHGQGTFFYGDGNVYYGQWAEDKLQGTGKLTIYPGTALEETYQGEFQNGLKHGFGRYTYAAGGRSQNQASSYEGNWASNLRHGMGTLRFRDGRVYRGQFVREKMHGQGTMIFPDGTRYSGLFKDNERTGTGALLAADGTIHSGKFLKGLKEGAGEVTYLGGSTYFGEWKRDAVQTSTKGEYALKVGPTSAEVVKLRVFGF